MDAAVSADDFVAAMSLHVASVCVITTRVEGVRYGLTATAVTSICAAPPRLMVCVNKSGITHQMIRAAGTFAVNVLAEDQDEVAQVFAGMRGTEDDRFDTGAWGSMTTGAPVLDGAVARFDCRVAEVSEQSSHAVIFGDVMAVEAQPGADTLLYGGRRFRRLGKLDV